MPRVVYKKFYGEHDDRGNGSAIRKVSFMNGGGRVNKKNRKTERVFKQFLDGDVEMGGGERKHWKGKNNGKRNFRRQGSPGVRGQGSHPSQVPLKLSDWYQVRILYGSKYEKNVLLRLLLRHLSPEVFFPVSYGLSGNDVVFYVDDFNIAQLLRNANRKILLEDGRLMTIKVREGMPPSIPVDDALKEKIKFIMAKRYVAETKALDLSKFASDPDFGGDIYCPLARPAILKAVWQIISENISDLMAIKLDKNKISVMDDSNAVEIKKLKNLRILHLEENYIKSLHVLNCFKDSGVTELVLRKNPLVKFFKDNTHYVRYDAGVSEVRKKFPKLTKLDDMELPPVISFDVTDEAKLPSPQPAFMCNPDGRGIVKEFLYQYFAIYDSDNRMNLAQAYHETSSFSLCSYYPPNQKCSNASKLNNYIQENRNLLRVTDYPRRKSRLHLGKQNIIQFLNRLPKSNHDLSSFVVDLTLFTPVLISLTVGGVFREPNSSAITKNWPIRHFSRVFLIVPVGQGFCIINDMLLVTNATENEIESSFKETANPAILQSPPGVVQNPSAVQSPGGVVPESMNDSVRVQMIQTLATKTGMNLAWSQKCLDETQWDFDRAIWTFNELQSKGSIPAEAFVK